jgi:hypothetical protein
MSASGYDAFLSLAGTLSEAGWEIMKFENLGGGVELTIVPLPEKKGAE